MDILRLYQDGFARFPADLDLELGDRALLQAILRWAEELEGDQVRLLPLRKAVRLHANAPDACLSDLASMHREAIRRMHGLEKLRLSERRRLSQNMYTGEATDLCEVFKREASLIWEKTTRAWSVGISLGEEGITEHLIAGLMLSRLPRKQLYVVKTSKILEADTGCDWEMWIRSSPKGWTRYCVQAKRLYRNGYYTALGHITRRKSGELAQMDQLEEYAMRNQGVPLFCFFNGNSDKCQWDKLDIPPCADFHAELGCTVAHLSDIKRCKNRITGRGERSWRFHARIFNEGKALPWSCLVCCGEDQGCVAELRRSDPQQLPDFLTHPNDRLQHPPASDSPNYGYIVADLS